MKRAQFETGAEPARARTRRSGQARNPEILLCYRTPSMINKRKAKSALVFTLSAATIALLNHSTAAIANGVIPAQEAETQAKLAKYSINWINSLPEAQQKARLEHKPILWLHVLGNIDGFT
jgi:hypothetical protein